MKPTEDKEAMLNKEEFFRLHEDFFGKGSGSCCEIDDSDLCFRVAKSQLLKLERLGYTREGVSNVKSK